jgi:flagellar hook-associated protein 2
MASVTSSSGISTTLGSYSGITSDDIESLLAADSVNKTRAQNKITTITAQKTAWSDISTRLTNFLNKVEALQKVDAYQTKKVTTSNSSIASIAGTTDAPEGTYDLKVNQLATATKVTGTKVADSSTTALNISGQLTLTSAEVNDKGEAITATIEISSEQTLKDVAAKINEQTKTTSIAASIVDNRLILTNSKMGDKTFLIDGDAVEGLGIGATATTTQGQPALFELDGLAISRDSNSVTDVIDGVTLTLAKKSDEHVTLSLTNDTSKIVDAVQGLVDQYNSLMSFIGEKLSVGDPSSEDNTTGALVGDSALTRLQAQLRNLITIPSVSGSALTPNKLGISNVDNEGTLGLDTTKLKEAIAADPSAVKTFFYASTKTKAADGTSTTTESGYTLALKELANSYVVNTSTNKGVIATKSATYDTTIKDLNKQIERFDDILAMKKERYVTMFTKLDTVMMEAESQLSYLTSQFSTTSSS